VLGGAGEGLGRPRSVAGPEPVAGLLGGVAALAVEHRGEQRV
jgi:hypothetical protein